MWCLFRCTLVTCVCILGIIDTSRTNFCVSCSCNHSCANCCIELSVLQAFYTNSFHLCFRERMYVYYYWECQSWANVLLRLYIGATVWSAFFTSSFQLFMLLIMHVGSFSSFIWIFTASYEDSGAGKYSALREPLLETLFVVFTPNILIFTLSWFWQSLRIAKLMQYPFFFFWPFHLRSCIY